MQFPLPLPLQFFYTDLYLCSYVLQLRLHFGSLPFTPFTVAVIYLLYLYVLTVCYLYLQFILRCCLPQFTFILFTVYPLQFTFTFVTFTFTPVALYFTPHLRLLRYILFTFTFCGLHALRYFTLLVILPTLLLLRVGWLRFGCTRCYPFVALFCSCPVTFCILHTFAVLPLPLRCPPLPVGCCVTRCSLRVGCCRDLVQLPFALHLRLVILVVPFSLHLYLCSFTPSCSYFTHHVCCVYTHVLLPLRCCLLRFHFAVHVYIYLYLLFWLLPRWLLRLPQFFPFTLPQFLLRWLLVGYLYLLPFAFCPVALYGYSSYIRSLRLVYPTPLPSPFTFYILRVYTFTPLPRLVPGSAAHLYPLFVVTFTLYSLPFTFCILPLRWLLFTVYSSFYFSCSVTFWLLLLLPVCYLPRCYLRCSSFTRFAVGYVYLYSLPLPFASSSLHVYTLVPFVR